MPISQTLVDEGIAVAGVDASATLISTFRARFPDAPAEHGPRPRNRSVSGPIVYRADVLLTARRGVQLTPFLPMFPWRSSQQV